MNAKTWRVERGQTGQPSRWSHKPDSCWEQPVLIHVFFSSPSVRFCDPVTSSKEGRTGSSGGWTEVHWCTSEDEETAACLAAASEKQIQIRKYKKYILVHVALAIMFTFVKLECPYTRKDFHSSLVLLLVKKTAPWFTLCWSGGSSTDTSPNVLDQFSVFPVIVISDEAEDGRVIREDCGQVLKKNG